MKSESYLHLVFLESGVQVIAIQIFIFFLPQCVKVHHGFANVGSPTATVVPICLCTISKQAAPLAVVPAHAPGGVVPYAAKVRKDRAAHVDQVATAAAPPSRRPHESGRTPLGENPGIHSRGAAPATVRSRGSRDFDLR